MREIFTLIYKNSTNYSSTLNIKFDMTFDNKFWKGDIEIRPNQPDIEKPIIYKTSGVNNKILVLPTFESAINIKFKNS